MFDVRKKTEELGEKFTIEAAYGSKSSLWSEGYKAGLVTEEELTEAREFYGRLWYYTGD